MSNKELREQKEIDNLFKDPKTARQAWKAIGTAILRNPAAIPVTEIGKEGCETYQSQLQRMTYEQLTKDLKELGKKERQPTEIEMIMACQIVKARTDTSAAIFVRDTLGAKPIDESKVDQTVNNFEQLTDEELELLAKYREANKKDVSE